MFPSPVETAFPGKGRVPTAWPLGFHPHPARPLLSACRSRAGAEPRALKERGLPCPALLEGIIIKTRAAALRLMTLHVQN